MNKKLLTTMLVMIAAVSIIAVAGVVLYFNLSSDKTEAAEEKLSASDLIELSIDTKEITTNLKDQGFAKVQFRIQVDSPEAKKELETRMFQVQNSIIYELSGTKAAELQGPDGIQKLETDLQKTINGYLEHGKVVRVYTTQKVVQ